MNIDKKAVLEAFEYLLLKEVNYEGLPQEWIDVREKMIPVINEAFCCGCEFIEKKSLEKDEFDFIGKKGKYSTIQVKYFCNPPLMLFDGIFYTWDAWLEFKPYDPKLFKGNMVINSKKNSLELTIKLPEEKAIEITVKGNNAENYVEYCALLHYNDEWKKDRVFYDLKH